ncbi:MAG: hypothetical protein E6K98_03680 [Thaumarchaeota archaeon]|nr:MAG: hypothetical protein E6K98_03680 [Nitrososphaerota archaeon]TLX94224.1 MAG: hypothetical protein E6K91_07105 [Nitrososphaerota archaeon]
MVSKGKIVIIACFAGLGVMMLYFLLYANSFQPELQRVQIGLVSIKVLDVDKIDKRAHLEVKWTITNPTTVTTTISTIYYELYANGNKIGEGHYTVEDIPMAGRPALFPSGNVTLVDKFELVNTDKITNEYDAITAGQAVKYEAKGQATVESAWTLITKDFDLTLG